MGGVKSIRADVRIIAATNRTSRRQVNGREVPEDLYYRLNVIPIHIPPLARGRTTSRSSSSTSSRRRPRECQKKAEFSKTALSALMRTVARQRARAGEPGGAHGGPVRLSTHRGGRTSLKRFSRLAGVRIVQHLIDLPDSGIDLSSAVNEFERNIIIRALTKSNWSRTGQPSCCA